MVLFCVSHKITWYTFCKRVGCVWFLFVPNAVCIALFVVVVVAVFFLSIKIQDIYEVVFGILRWILSIAMKKRHSVAPYYHSSYTLPSFECFCLSKYAFLYRYAYGAVFFSALALAIVAVTVTDAVDIILRDYIFYTLCVRVFAAWSFSTALIFPNFRLLA